MLVIERRHFSQHSNKAQTRWVIYLKVNIKKDLDELGLKNINKTSLSNN